MKTLVIYGSQFGNTEILANTVAATFKPFGKAEAVRVSSVLSDKLADQDLLIFASPTVAWRELPDMQVFLDTIDPKAVIGKKIMLFETVMHLPKFIKGSAVKSMLAILASLGAGAPVSTESFFVVGREGPLQKGEVERAAAWARSIVS